MTHGSSSRPSLLDAALTPATTVVVQAALALDPAFLVSTLLCLLLRKGHGVVLVAVQHTAAHYKQALRKLGLDVTSCLSSGRLVVVAVLSRNASDVLAEASFTDRITSAVRSVGTAADVAAPDHHQASSASGSQSTVQQVGIVCDDLAQLGGLLADAQDWDGTLRRLSAHCCSPVGGPTVSLLAVVPTDVADTSAAQFIAGGAPVKLNVLPLAAGRSVDVTGRIQMLLRDWQANPREGTRHRQDVLEFWFKADSSDAHFLQFYGAA